MTEGAGLERPRPLTRENAMKPGETVKIECGYCGAYYALTYQPDVASATASEAHPDTCQFCGEDQDDSFVDSDLDSDDDSDLDSDIDDSDIDDE